MKDSLHAIDSGALRWMMKTAHKNLWRVYHNFDIDDLIQEGHLIYLHVVNRYPEAENRRHIMSLFQRSFINHIHNLAKRQTREETAIDCTCDPPEPTYEDCFLTTLMLNRATFPVKDAINTLTDDKNCKQLRAPYRRYKDGTRQTLNDRVTRLLELPSFDIMGMAKKYIGG